MPKDPTDFPIPRNPVDALRLFSHTLGALADLYERGANDNPGPSYYTAKTWPYGTPRSMRAAIHAGRVPASKCGSEYRVPRDAADDVFAPKLVKLAPKKKAPRTETARLAESLRAAGVKVSK